MNQLNRIKKKLRELKRLDKDYSVFGAEKHKYKLNPLLNEKTIEQFEEEFNIRLPEGYRSFLKELGNGGAGPYYGLEPLENGRYADLDYKPPKDLINPALPFVHTEAWNLANGEINEDNETEYFDKKWVNGLLRVSNYGCAISINLVINGMEYGNMWVDDRGNDGGIFPDPFFKPDSRVDFLEWYELWLDQSLGEVSG